MPEPCVSFTIRMTQHAAHISGIALNILLVLLIAFRTTSDFKKYSRVLVAHCVADVLFIAACILVEVHIMVHDGIVFALLGGPAASSDTHYNLLLFLTYIHAELFMVVICAAPPAYRFLMISRRYTMPSRQYVLLVLSLFILAACNTAGIGIFLLPSVDVISINDVDVISSISCSYEGILPAIYVNNWTISALVPAILGTLWDSATYLVVAWCTIAVWKSISHGAAMTAKTLSMQRRLTYMLLTQAMLPLALIVVPVTLTVAGVVFGSENLMTFAPLCTVFLSFVPVLNPLVTIVFVKPYHRALWNAVQSVLPRRYRKIAPTSTAMLHSI